jgi:hypothetical protein
VPRKRSPENIGTSTAERLRSVPGKWCRPSGFVVGATADDDRSALEQRPVDRARQRVGQRAEVAAHPVLVGVEDAAHPVRVVAPRDHHVAGREHLAQLVADQVDDALEVERAGHALLDAVDHRKLAGALFRRELGLTRFVRALLDLRLQAFGEAGVGERDRGLRGEQRDPVAVGLVEAPEGAPHVGVQMTDQAVLRDQRRDQAGALFDRLGAVRTVTQAGRAGSLGLRRATALMAASSAAAVLAARQPRAGKAPTLRRLEDEQHALGADQPSHRVDQEFVQRAGAAQRVQAQPGIDQASERPERARCGCGGADGATRASRLGGARRRIDPRRARRRRRNGRPLRAPQGRPARAPRLSVHAAPPPGAAPRPAHRRGSA